MNGEKLDEKIEQRLGAKKLAASGEEVRNYRGWTVTARPSQTFSPDGKRNARWSFSYSNFKLGIGITELYSLFVHKEEGFKEAFEGVDREEAKRDAMRKYNKK